MVHIFDNGVQVEGSLILPIQLERYKVINLHEPEEEAEFVKLILEITNINPVFMDVGSAIGYYSILAHKLNPKISVIALEPFSRYRNATIHNWKLNFQSDDKIKVFDVALSDQVGKSGFVTNDFGSSLIMHETIFNQMKSSLKAIFNKDKKVKTTTLDELISRNKIGRIDLLKMDIQGAELKALNGARKSLERKIIDRWIVGTHSSLLHDQCINVFLKAGYKIRFEQKVIPNQPDGLIIAVKL